jgi:hypothetical protein
LEDTDQLTRVGVFLSSKNGLAAIRQPNALDHAMHHLRMNRYQEALACFSREDTAGRGFVNFKIGMEHVRATEFEEASVFWAVACDEGLDPRLLIQAWPDLVQRSAPDASTWRAQVWQGAQDDIHELSQGMEAIIMASLYKNYSPHIKPEDESRSLHAQLTFHSRSMIRLVLSSYREASAQESSLDIQTAVFAALARLAAEEGAVDDCLSLAVAEGVDTEDLLRWLTDRSLDDLRSQLLQRMGRADEALDLWIQSVLPHPC